MANIYTGSDVGQEDAIVGEITLVTDGAAGTPALNWLSDTDTGLFLAGTGIIGFSTAGTERVRMGTTELTVNDGGNDVDFRIEGVGVANALFVQGSDGFVGIGNGAPTVALHVTGSVLISTDLEIDGVLNHDGTTVGFYGEPPVTQGTATGIAGFAPTAGAPSADSTVVDSNFNDVATAINSIVTLLSDLGLSA